MSNFYEAISLPHFIQWFWIMQFNRRKWATTRIESIFYVIIFTCFFHRIFHFYFVNNFFYSNKKHIKFYAVYIERAISQTIFFFFLHFTQFCSHCCCFVTLNEIGEHYKIFFFFFLFVKWSDKTTCVFMHN